MNDQEIQAELAAAQSLLDESSFAHLAYTAKDGTPRVVPIGLYWTGEEAVMATATTSPKVASLSARPDVALTVDAGGTPGDARAVSIRGTARVEIVDGVVEEYLLAARRSMGNEGSAEFENQVRTMYPQMARIAVTPTWVRYWDFGAGRIPPFLRELADKARG